MGAAGSVESGVGDSPAADLDRDQSVHVSSSMVQRSRASQPVSPSLGDVGHHRPSTDSSHNSSLTSSCESNIEPMSRNMSGSSDQSSITPPPLSINEDQQKMVRKCLGILESGFFSSGVHFNADHALPHVETVSKTDGSIVDGEPLLTDSGLYIIEEGQLDLCAADGQTVSQRLLAGDFFGELSSLFRVSTPTVVSMVTSQLSLLHLPAESIRECVNIDEGGKGFSRKVMLNWCAKNSYLGSYEIFGRGELAQRVVSNCLRASVLSDLTQEAINFIAELSKLMLFDTGDIVYSAGEDAGYLFLVLRGGVELLIGSKVTHTKNVRYSDEGYCLAVQEFFTGAKLSHHARAASPLTVSLLSKEVLMEMLNKFPNEIHKIKLLTNTLKAK